MNKINPFYILGFFVLMALLMMYENHHMEQKISAKAQANAATQILGKKVASLKSRWKNPKQAQKKIDAVLGLKQFSSKVRKRVKKSGVYKIEVAELNAREVDTLVTKLLNETVSVKSLKIVRNGDKNVTVDWEFAL